MPTDVRSGLPSATIAGMPDDRRRRPLVNPRRCPAPRPIGPGSCGHLIKNGAPVCDAPRETDPKRVCGAPAGSGPDKPPCRAWPLKGLPFCELHDPQLREERRLERESVTGQLARVREALHDADKPVLARVIDQLVTTQRVQAEDVTMLLRTWGAAR